MGQPGLRNSFDAPHEFPLRRDAGDEAGYCLARAEAEARWAEEAVHPAARRAHLHLAGLYRRRALDARQVSVDEIQNWVSEGGSIPAAA
ncbi:MAG: hypothetical protein JWO81_166 [Alphaproteobacteria bacterium]|nr:hypothetical protein [Alphaproteobacteria bacterium]